ncbi:MAG TPA: hypothetical protein VIE42_14825 [Steroidobacteraceae bacterium]
MAGRTDIYYRRGVDSAGAGSWGLVPKRPHEKRYLKELGTGLLALLMWGAACAYAGCAPELVDVGGYRLWMQIILRWRIRPMVVQAGRRCSLPN